MRCCSNCAAPESVTNVYNSSLAASQIAHEVLTVSAGLTVTLAELPGDPIILLFLDGVIQIEGTNYTVSYITGVITLIGAVAGQTVAVVYIES